MKIPLPENYSYEDVAEVKDGILYVHKFNFEDLMYDLTYVLKDSSKCYYCGKAISRDKSTLDHLYPRDFGGPTIPNNLAICCSSCNNTKTNMTEEQFLYFSSILDVEKQKEFYRDISLHNHIFMKWYGPIIPKEWISEQKAEKITVYFFIGKGVNGKTYKKVEKNYKKYRRIIRPIIVDRNFKLLSGFNVLLFAKNNSIDTLPTIVLENVELD